jgi:GTP1/Obg family GTP-binding protein
MQDWDVVAKKDHLSLMQTEALRLEALIKQIHEEMMTLRTLEEKMRDLNGRDPAGITSSLAEALLI